MKRTSIISAEQAITAVAGEGLLPLFKVLNSNRTIAEHKLAEKVNQEVNQTRTMLYKLHQVNLVSFTKKKDRKKGWYVYYWSLKKDRLKKLTVDIGIRKELQLEQKEAHERGKTTFRCTMGCTSVSLEDAMDLEFRCQECGELMGCDDSGRTIISIEEEQSSKKELARHK
ncbi:MAG: hypothetical protein AABX51_05065 [Nanoarchaeota archaeon]